MSFINIVELGLSKAKVLMILFNAAEVDGLLPSGQKNGNMVLKDAQNLLKDGYTRFERLRNRNLGGIRLSNDVIDTGSYNGINGKSRAEEAINEFLSEEKELS